MVELRAMSALSLLQPADPSPAAALCRGVCRSLAERGYAALTEFPLANGRRADVMALGRGGDLVIVEVKSSVADFRADRKWPDYWEFCDRLYFAVAADFPRGLVPPECGLLVADPFGAALLRDPPARRLPAARRKAVTLRFALAAATRLRRMIDPASAVQP
jgi:hypothetical protein